MNVELVDAATGFRMTLDPALARILLRELRHEKKSRPHGVGVAVRTDYGCIIIARDAAGRERVHYLYDRTVVLERSTNQSWQFFFGLLVAEWLAQAQPTPAPVPFQPIP